MFQKSESIFKKNEEKIEKVESPAKLLEKKKDIQTNDNKLQ